MEMEEDERLFIDVDAPFVLSNLIATYIPGSDIRPFMMQNHYSREPIGPAVQVLLIGKSSILYSVVAPLDALLPPPAQTRHRVLVASKRQPPHIVDTMSV